MQAYFPFLIVLSFVFVGILTKHFIHLYRFRIIWEATLLTYVFFIGTITSFGLSINLIKWGNEILVLAYFFRNYLKIGYNKNFYFPTYGIFILICLLILLSLIINDSNPIDSFYFLRFFLSPILFFWGVYNSYLNDPQIRKLNSYIFFLFAFQIIAQLIKSILWDGFPENPVGSITVAGGGVASFIPLFAFGFILCFYFFFRKDRKYWLLFLGFVFVGIASQKRAAFYFLPIVALSFLLITQWAYHSRRAFTQLRAISFISIIVPSVIYISASYNNIVNKGSEKINLALLIEQAEEYSTAKDEEEGLVYGRIAAFQRTLELVQESSLVINLFGHGPSTVKGFKRGDMKMEKFGFGSTFPGWTYQYLQIGLLGCIFYGYLLWNLLKRISRILKRERDSYWIAIEIGTLICFVLIFIDFFFYSITSFTIYAITYPLFCMTAVIYKRQQSLHQIAEKNFI